MVSDDMPMLPPHAAEYLWIENALVNLDDRLQYLRRIRSCYVDMMRIFQKPTTKKDAVKKLRKMGYRYNFQIFYQMMDRLGKTGLIHSIKFRKHLQPHETKKNVVRDKKNSVRSCLWEACI
jgi:hypothetical protein